MQNFEPVMTVFRLPGGRQCSRAAVPLRYCHSSAPRGGSAVARLSGSTVLPLSVQVLLGLTVGSVPSRSVLLGMSSPVPTRPVPASVVVSTAGTPLEVH